MNLKRLPSVEQTAHDKFWVINASIGPFRTHEAAWRWIDQHTEEGRADTDRYNRIRMAFSKCTT